MLHAPGAPKLHNAHHLIREHLAVLDIPEPDGVTRANALADALAHHADAHALEPIRSAIESGTLDPTDAGTAVADAALALLRHERAAEVAKAVAPSLDAAARRALREDAPGLMEALRSPFDDAVAQVVDALAMFGPGKPDPAVLLADPRASQVHHEATEARATLSAIVTVRQDLADVGYGPRHESPTWWIVRSDDVADAPHGLLRIIEAGMPVRVNTAEESAAVGAAHAAELERRRDAKRERQRRADESHPLVRAWRRHAQTVGDGPKDAA